FFPNSCPKCPKMSQLSQGLRRGDQLKQPSTLSDNCGVENDTMPPKVSFCVGPDPQTKMLSIRHFHCLGASNDTGQKKNFGIICCICTPQDRTRAQDAARRH